MACLMDDFSESRLLISAYHLSSVGFKYFDRVSRVHGSPLRWVQRSRSRARKSPCSEEATFRPYIIVRVSDTVACHIEPFSDSNVQWIACDDHGV